MRRYLLSRSPLPARGCSSSIRAAASASPRSGGGRGLGAADASPGPCKGLWEYPAPRGARDAPSCTNPAAQGFLTLLPSPTARRSPRDRWQIIRKRRFRPRGHREPLRAASLRGGTRPSALTPLQRILLVARRRLWSRRSFGAGISSGRPSGVPKRGGAAAPLFSSAAIVHRPNCSAPSCKGERGER